MTQKFFIKLSLDFDISIVFKYLWDFWQVHFVPTQKQKKNVTVSACGFSVYYPKYVTFGCMYLPKVLIIVKFGSLDFFGTSIISYHLL